MTTPPRPILNGCHVLPPLEPLGNDDRAAAEALHAPRNAAVVKGHNGRRRAVDRTSATQHATAGRFQTINTFADSTLGGLSRSEIAVWLLLWRDTKPNELATAAQVDLARRAGTTDRHVRRAIERLERKGLLTVVHRGGFRRGPSTYRVHAVPVERSPPKAARNPRPP